MIAVALVIPSGYVSGVNLLAHALLAHHSFDTPNDLQVCGAFMADFSRGLKAQDVDPLVWSGLVHHRAIDEFTDGHPAFRGIRARLEPLLPRLTAGIVVDLFWDHVLALEWERFGASLTGLPLSDFTASIYSILTANQRYLNGDLPQVLPWIISGDWLQGYASVEGMGRALHGLSTRMSRAGALRGKESLIAELYPELRQSFGDFWTELLPWAKGEALRRP